MTFDAFRISLAQSAPPDGLDLPRLALWWAAKGDWMRAHALVNDAEGASAAWVHAHLHRAEGDVGNAGYWYRRAGRPVSQASAEAEWNELARTLAG